SGAQLRLKPNTLDLTADTSHVFSPGSLIADANETLWFCWKQGTGQTAGLSPISVIPAFSPLPRPQRVYDSRPGEPPGAVAKGRLSGFANQQRVVNVVSSAGASSIVAAMLTLTVVNTTGSGFLATFA